MAERIPEWAKTAATKLIDYVCPECKDEPMTPLGSLNNCRTCGFENAGIVNAFAAIIAQHAPPDVEAMLRELGEATGGYPVRVSIRPQRCQESTGEAPVSIDFHLAGHPRCEGYVSAPSIPAAVAEARRAMG